eukprot:7652661-Pyramimonas_sp.AAC.1
MKCVQHFPNLVPLRNPCTMDCATWNAHDAELSCVSVRAAVRSWDSSIKTGGGKLRSNAVSTRPSQHTVS